MRVTEHSASIVIPVKPFSMAKSRLASVLTPTQRSRLAEAMFQDVLRVAMSVVGASGVLVVSGDRNLAEQLRATGIAVLDEAKMMGHSEAVADAVGVLSNAGETRILSIPADVPTVTAEELRFAVEQIRTRSLLIVPDRCGTGTNALGFISGDPVTFHFGPNSRVRHTKSARAAGLVPTFLTSAGLGLDVDAPDDLAQLIAVNGVAPRTLEVISKYGIVPHPQVAVSANG